ACNPQGRRSRTAQQALRSVALRVAAKSTDQHDPASHGRGTAGAGPLLAGRARHRRGLHDALEGLAMKLKRHTTEVFSMSFLDCICCGFGAMILILVLTETGQPVVLERVRPDMHGQVAKLQAELYEIRGETDVLNRDLKGRIEQLSTEKTKLARLQGDLSTIKGQYQTSQKEAEIQNAEEGQLVAAYQKLTAEMERLLAAGYRRPKTAAVGGIPVDSEYIIFVVDTSGSMQENHWDPARKMMQEILDIHPKVKGIQVMDDEGAYMFDGYRGQWIADTPARRKAIMDRFKTWTSFS